jgi:hypothetical protein
VISSGSREGRERQFLLLSLSYRTDRNIEKEKERKREKRREFQLSKEGCKNVRELYFLL